MTMADGTVKLRVSIQIVDEFDDSWAAGFGDLAFADSVPIGDISDIRTSPHALPADLATKAMHGEEWKMGAYRYAVVLDSGEVLSLGGANAVWLPDSLETSDVVDVIPNPTEDHELGGGIPRPEQCFVSAPQLLESDREMYEQHFGGIDVSERQPLTAAALQQAHAYAQRHPLRERPIAYAAMKDALTTGESRYERFMGDDIDLLLRFARREGHLDIPRNHVEAGRPLNLIGIAMARSQGLLSDDDRRRLDEIPGWETAVEDAGNKVIGFSQLRPPL